MYALTPIDFIQLKPSNQQISVLTDKNEDAGVYDLALTVSPQTSGVTKTIAFKVNVVNECLTAVVKTPTKIPNLNELVLAKSTFEFSFQFEHSVQNTTDCGTVEFTVRDAETKLTPIWAVLEGPKLRIDFSSQSKAIKSQMELFAALTKYPDRNYTQPFNVTLSDLAV